MLEFGVLRQQVHNVLADFIAHNVHEIGAGGDHIAVPPVGLDESVGDLHSFVEEVLGHFSLESHRFQNFFACSESPASLLVDFGPRGNSVNGKENQFPGVHHFDQQIQESIYYSIKHKIHIRIFSSMSSRLFGWGMPMFEGGCVHGWMIPFMSK